VNVTGVRRMSLDPKSLKRSDGVIFGGKVARVVREIYYGCDNGNAIMSIWFTDGYGLRASDPLWEVAELVTETQDDPRNT
jgi:hypothetical protein